MYQQTSTFPPIPLNHFNCLKNVPISEDRKNVAQAAPDVSSQEPKVKLKSRGTKIPEVEIDAQDIHPPAAIELQPAFAFIARALEVFDTLFESLPATSTPGEVAWTELL
jgi:hypothetical protein